MILWSHPLYSELVRSVAFMALSLDMMKRQGLRLRSLRVQLHCTHTARSQEEIREPGLKCSSSIGPQDILERDNLLFLQNVFKVNSKRECFSMGVEIFLPVPHVINVCHRILVSFTVPPCLSPKCSVSCYVQQYLHVGQNAAMVAHTYLQASEPWIGILLVAIYPPLWNTLGSFYDLVQTIQCYYRDWGNCKNNNNWNKAADRKQCIFV